MNFKQRFLKRKKTYIALVILLVIVLFSMASGGGRDVERTASVIRTDLQTFVKVSGTVVPQTRVEMAFERSGTVSTVFKEVGETVAKGQTIAIVNTGEADAAYRQIEARYRELQRGTRSEELAISEAEYGSTVRAEEAAQLKVNASAYSTLSAVEEAFSESIDTLFDNPRSALPKLKTQLVSQTRTREIESRRAALEQMMKSWRATANASEDINPELVLKNTTTVRQFVEALLVEIDALRRQNSESQALDELATFRAALIDAQTTLANAYTALTTVTKEYDAAVTAKNVSQQSLALKQAGTSREELDQVAAELASAAADRGKFMIIAPFSGIVTKQDAKVGQYVQAGDIVVHLMSDAPYKIESYVPEISIGEIMVGQGVTIEVEALPGQEVMGTVVAIEPTETLIDDVSNYKVTMSFEQLPSIRSGMTVNNTISTGKKENVLAVPREFVVREGGKNTVAVMRDEKIVSVPVTTGYSSDDGMIEIGGLQEGDTIVKLKK